MANFAQSVVEAAPAGRLALVELARDGARHEWSFGQVARAARTLAARLHEQGVRRGDTVLTLVGNRPDWVVAMVACFRQGHVVLPCNEQLRAGDLRLRLAACPPALVVCDERNDAVLAQAGWDGPTIIGPGVGGSTELEPPPAADLAAQDPCLITFTSGTAGEPKPSSTASASSPARRCRPSTGSRRDPATSSGARPPAAGASRRATPSSHPGSGARRRCCTTRASTRTSAWRCSHESASACCAWRRRSTA